MGTILDPRFKKAGFADTAMYRQAVERLTLEASNHDTQQFNEHITVESSPHPTGSIPDRLTGSGLWDTVDERVQASRISSNANSMVVLRSYLDLNNMENNSLIPLESIPR
jgi:hypothetical protein